MSILIHKPSVVRRRNKNRRAGYVYVAVLFTTLIVAGAIASALALDTARLRAISSSADRQVAQRLAESELHRALIQLNEETDWRTRLIAGQFSDWVDAMQLSGKTGSTTRFAAMDDDGQLADDWFDDVQLVAVARHGNAQTAISATLSNGHVPLEVLRYSVTALDDIRIENSAVLSAERAIQVDDDCKTSSSGWITAPNLYCDGSIQISVRSDLSSDQIILPTFDIVQRHLDLATSISPNLLPFHSGGRAIYRIVLSENANPFGDTNPHAIYSIDAQGYPVAISSSRIEGTLVIVNASSVLVTGAVCWESKGAMLVTDSPLFFQSVAPVLDESIEGTNFNPESTPYRGFDHNQVLTDQLPTSLRGVIYCTEDITVYPTTNGAPLEITGVVVADDLHLWNDLSVRSYDELLYRVPLGLADPRKLKFKAGTFQRVESP